MTIEETIELAISEIESKLPQLSQADIDRYASLKERLDNLHSERKAPPADGACQVELNKEYLTLLKEVLTTYKELIVPELMKQEIYKLRGIAQMAKVVSNG